MAYPIIYHPLISEAFTLFSGFQCAETMKNTSKPIAVAKIRASTLALQATLAHLKYLTPRQAANELDGMRVFIPFVAKLSMALEAQKEEVDETLKPLALNFLGTLDRILIHLQDMASLHMTYELSQPVIAQDWDSCQDEHWNHY